MMKNKRIMKEQKKSIYKKGITQKRDRFTFGNYGLVSQKNGFLTTAPIEALRLALRRELNNNSAFKISVNPKIHIRTKKAEGVRMGRGKGNFFDRIYFVRRGEIIVELKLPPKYAAASRIGHRILTIATSKLGIPTSIKVKSTNLSDIKYPELLQSWRKIGEP